jgi:CheY-like chemotaxis protein
MFANWRAGSAPNRPGVHEITAAMLREAGFEIIEAGSGGAALELIERVQPIDLLLIDFAMPGMSGTEVTKRVRAEFPTLPILFITGFADRTALAGVHDAQVVGKPFIDDELVRRVRGAVYGS